MEVARLLSALCVALALLAGCDATTGGVRSQQMAPYPYNSPY